MKKSLIKTPMKKTSYKKRTKKISGKKRSTKKTSTKKRVVKNKSKYNKKKVGGGDPIISPPPTYKSNFSLPLNVANPSATISTLEKVNNAVDKGLKNTYALGKAVVNLPDKIQNYADKIAYQKNMVEYKRNQADIDKYTLLVQKLTAKNNLLVNQINFYTRFNPSS